MTTRPPAQDIAATTDATAGALAAPHAVPAQKVLHALAAAGDGLDPAEAARRLAATGPNRLPEPPRRSGFARLLDQFDNVLIYVLLGAAVVTAALGHWVDTGVILAVVVVNAAIGFLQEGRAERAMEAIRRMLAPRATVLRDGRRMTVDGETVVPGDIVLLEAGDRVPADLRLVHERGLAIDEAILTGESVPVEKATAAVPAGVPLGDRRSMAFSGTMVTQGAARGVVTATGAATEIGRIGGLLAGVEPLSTPLVRQMDRLGRNLTAGILVLSLVILGLGLWDGERAFAELFMAVVGLAVAAVPEGLPAVMTVTLAIGVQAMARRHAIVRRLPAIEAIGTVSVICTDKTGTLTRNEMMVATVHAAGVRHAVAGDGYAPKGAITPPGDGLAALARAAAFCNDADLHRRDGHWTVEGDPMEGALLAFARKVPGWTAEGWTRKDAIPFDSRHRFMAVLHAGPEGDLIHVKGAPERVFAMCHDAMGPDGPVPLDHRAWHRAAEEIAGQGQRVLALASRRARGDRLSPDGIDHRLTLLGLVGLIDPPRPGTVDAIAECHAAGIAVKMITGDHAGTAAAIAGLIGLQNPGTVLTGAELDALSDAELAERIDATNVFARTSPEHKLRLVMALQARGQSVAMTGDGVNDAPALKRAEAGIAMGLKGSEAAKEAAQLVLADDNFASIVAAVREGRTVQDNLRKVISFELPTSAGEALTVVVALLFGLALPVTAVQILWVNLITGVTLGIALAFEPTEARTMERPPRPRDAPLLSGALVWHVVLVSGLFLAAVFGVFAHGTAQGHALALTQTMAVNMLVVLEIFHLFFIRYSHGTSLSWRGVKATPVVWTTVAIITLAQFAITYLPPLQGLLGTVAVPWQDGLVIVGVGVAFFLVLEAEKQVRLRLSRRR